MSHIKYLMNNEHLITEAETVNQGFGGERFCYGTLRIGLSTFRLNVCSAALFESEIFFSSVTQLLRACLAENRLRNNFLPNKPWQERRILMQLSTDAS